MIQKNNKNKLFPIPKQEIRLNKFISNSGICSRREADTLIKSNKIKVNGKIINKLGSIVQTTDEIKYNNKILKSEKFVYFILNKPKDFITTTKDPQNRTTVLNLLKNACNERIYPVGRLDRDTTGLLLLTNDGQTAQNLSHPSNSIKKIYQVTIDREINKEDIAKIRKGLILEDGPANIDEIKVIDSENKVMGLEIHMGKNRIIRRIFDHIGYKVIKLDRVMYGSLTKKNLPRGKYRPLTELEINQLKKPPIKK